MVTSLSSLFVTKDNIQDIQNRFHAGQLCFGVPLYKHISLHPIENSLAAMILYFDDAHYIAGIDHPDLPCEVPLTDILSVNTTTARGLYVIERKEFEHVCPEFQGKCFNLHDPSFYSDLWEFVKWSGEPDTIDSIPISKILEFADKWNKERIEKCLIYIGGDYTDRTIIPVYQYIEASGLKIDPTIFKKFFKPKHLTLKDDFVYSSYNIYNLTGRVTNAFDGINFLALNKTNGCRKAFVSRFGGGSLVSIDYESFHLRLVANNLQYPQPTIPFHEYLADQYIEAGILSSYERDRSKELTFSFMYGAEEIDGIPFFEAIKQYKEQLWNRFKNWGISLRYVVNSRTLVGMNKHKIFNYVVQNLEARETARVLQAVKMFLTNNKLQTKIILHVYDGVLFDLCPDDPPDTLFHITNLMSVKYPVRVYQGPNYHEMEEVIWA